MTPARADRWDVSPYLAAIERIEPCRWEGRVTELVGLLVESSGPAAGSGTPGSTSGEGPSSPRIPT